MSNVRHLIVAKDDDGQRLDRWLKRHVPELPYILAQKLMRQGQIRVDSKRAKAETRLKAGQDIRIPPIATVDARKQQRNAISDKDRAFIKSLVLYDDGDVLALNKPADLATQGGTKMKRHIDGLLDALKNKEGVKPRLVHRLDKDTSGVLLLARSAQAARALGDIFKGREAKKIYWAIVTPTPEVRQGTIKASLIKAGGPRKEKVIVDEKEGKKAKTEYSVIEDVGARAAFVAFWPRTGRMHQIRVHAVTMGCPIVGDGKYGGSAAKVDSMEHAKRMHLHARRIICPHPTRKGVIDITAPLPPELVTSWKNFGFNPNDKSDPFEHLEV
ncbi:MAG: RluA family pseudouridine synthase [Alphaproteobacteria bacterium]